MSNDTVGRLNVALDMRLNSLEASITKANQRVATMSRKMNSDVTKAAKAMNAALSSVGAGLSVAGVAAFTKSIIDLGGKITDLSRQAGISTDAFQTLTLVAMDSGVSGEQIAQSFVMMRKSIEEAASGSASAAKSFETLGLNAAALKAINADQAFEVIARSIVGAKDQSAAFNAALEILGAKTAPKLQEVLQQLGQEGFGKLKQEVEKFKLTPEQLKTLDDAGDKLERMWLYTMLIASKGIVGAANTPSARIAGPSGGSFSMGEFLSPESIMASDLYSKEDLFSLKSIDRPSVNWSQKAYDNAKNTALEAEMRGEVERAMAKSRTSTAAARDQQIYNDHVNFASLQKSQEELSALFDPDRGATFISDAEKSQEELNAIFTSGTETFSKDWEDALEKTSVANEQASRDMSQAWDYAMDGFSSAIADAVVDGELSFSNLANSFSKMVVQMAVKWALLKSIESMGFTSTIAGAKADGGPVAGGSTYLVGEEGPELFTPRSSGMIIPNDKLSSTTGGGRTTVINADLRGASVEAVARLEAFVRDIDATFNRRAVGAVIDAKQRGGGVGRALN